MDQGLDNALDSGARMQGRTNALPSYPNPPVVEAVAGGQGKARMATSDKTLYVVYDPSLSRPGGNITGVTAMSLELTGKRLPLLRELAPKLSRLGYLGLRNPRLGGALAGQERLVPALDTEIVRALDAAARPLAVSVQRAYAQGPEDIRDAIAGLVRSRVDALYVIEAPGMMVFRSNLSLGFMVGDAT